MAKVSIVLSSYNHAVYLDERIQSILGQTYRDFELIIIDDASTDDSKSVISKYAYDKRASTIFFDINSGSAYQRKNDGARLARGEYILFAESDDSCHPKLLERLVEKLDEHRMAGLAYAQSYHMDCNGLLQNPVSIWTDSLSKTRWNMDFFDEGKNEIVYLFCQNIIPNTSAVLIRREKFKEAGGFDVRLSLSADWMLWVKILLSSDVAFVSEPLNYFRCHPRTVRENTSQLVLLKEAIFVRSFIRRKMLIPKELFAKLQHDFARQWLKHLKNHKEDILSRENLYLCLAACVFDPKIIYKVTAACFNYFFRRIGGPLRERGDKRSNKIHCIYFTCSKHFDSLAISLKSLRRLHSRCIGNVYLYIDKEDFLTDAQIDLLHRLKFNLVIRKCKKITHYGEQLIITELESFIEVGKEIGREDYVVKIDSDVLFISVDIFQEVLKSGKDAIGQACDYWEPFIYFQGGCYFIKGSLISELRNFDRTILQEVLTAMNNETARKRQRFCHDLPEDAVIYYFIKTKTDKINLRDFYGTQDDLYNLSKKFSVIHFERSRTRMTKTGLLELALIRRCCINSGIFGIFLMRAIKAIRKVKRFVRKFPAKAYG